MALVHGTAQRGVSNWHSGMAKHFNYCLFSTPPLHEGFMVSGRLWTSVVEFGSPFLQGSWILLHRGMVRHSSSSFLLLACHPQEWKPGFGSSCIHLYSSQFTGNCLFWQFLVWYTGIFWTNSFTFLCGVRFFHFYRPGRSTWWLPLNMKHFSLGYVLWGAQPLLHCKCLNTCFHTFGCSLPKENNVSKLMFG